MNVIKDIGGEKKTRKCLYCVQNQNLIQTMVELPMLPFEPKNDRIKLILSI
jgi:hypothetical protein